MKKYITNLQTILIIVLVVAIILIKNCNKETTPSEPITITKVEVTHDTIVKEVTRYKPKYITVIEKQYDTTLVIDTVYVLNDYFSTYVYEDIQKLDSLNLTIRDSVSQNKISSRSIRYELIYPRTTITNTVYINNNEFYLGLGLQGSSKQLNYIGGELIYKNKKKHLYGLGIGVNQELQPVLSSRLYWKIGK
jgi:hypothetical protein